VIAITSETYSKQAAKGRVRLAEVADIVLDNGAPSGDATVAVPGSDLKVGPISTSIGAALLNAVMAEAARAAQADAAAPIYLSANMPGAAENNAALIKRYRPRNPTSLGHSAQGTAGNREHNNEGRTFRSDKFRISPAGWNCLCRAGQSDALAHGTAAASRAAHAGAAR
jgi:hypothetical protein